MAVSTTQTAQSTAAFSLVGFAAAAAVIFSFLSALKPPLNNNLTPGFISVQHRGRLRSAMILLPAQMNPGKLPVIFVLGDVEQNPNDVASSLQLQKLADSAQAAIVVPAQEIDPATRTGGWNAGECCGYAKTAKVDEASNLTLIRDRVLEDQRFDPDRVYVVGFGNGGMLAGLLAREVTWLAGWATFGSGMATYVGWDLPQIRTAIVVPPKPEPPNKVSTRDQDYEKHPRTLASMQYLQKQYRQSRELSVIKPPVNLPSGLGTSQLFESRRAEMVLDWIVMKPEADTKTGYPSILNDVVWPFLSESRRPHSKRNATY